MKILVVDTKDNKQTSSNSTNLCAGFKANGHDVHFFDYRVKGVDPNPGLVEFASQTKPAFIFMGKSELVRGETVQTMKKKTGAFIVHWYGDYRDNVQSWIVDIGRQCDVTAFMHKDDGTIKKYEAQWGKKHPIKFWMMGTNPNVFKPMDVAKIHDISFFGNNEQKLDYDGYAERRKILNFLARAGYKLGIYGGGWEQLAMQYSNVYYYPFVADDDFALAVNMSHFTLGNNPVMTVMCHGSWPRTLRCIACGVPHIRHSTAGVDQLLGGPGVLSYLYAEEFIEKFPTWWANKANNTYKQGAYKEMLYVKNNHTWRQAALRALEIFNAYRVC